MVRIIIVLSFLFFNACSLGYQAQCRLLQNNGQVQATLESCAECMAQFGSGNPEMINGCALGLDAAKLMAPK